MCLPGFRSASASRFYRCHFKQCIKRNGHVQNAFYLPSIIGGAWPWRLCGAIFLAMTGSSMHCCFSSGLIKNSLVSGPDKCAVDIDSAVCLAVRVINADFLAGLKNIPSSYLEAASVDGANRVRRFFKITLPILTPIIFFNLVMQTISAFMTFTPAYIISKGEGGPLDGTLLYSLYLFQRAFNYFQMGYASAMAWVMLLIVGLITLILFKTSSYWVHYESKEE